MYECPNCGANIKFDIKLQKMLCAFCDSTFDPFQVTEAHEVEEQNMMEVTVYTCSQCGGEIIGDDNEVATFCSFCGTSTILNSRIEKTRKPKKILPFKITKDDCAKAYKNLVRKAVFAPDYIKDPKRIDSFRAIYMPYWLYDMEKHGTVSYSAKHTYQKGDYEYTQHYALSADVDILYEGINYDASSSFSDNLSNAIAPFDAEQDVDFTSSFMSGFYADAMDVDAETYKTEVLEATRRDAADRLKRVTPKKNYVIEDNSVMNSLKLKTKKETLAMFPVWFMSYRTKDKNGEDRVLYSVINGQTGKAVADLPVDMKKYLIGSLILAIPFFFVFNFLFTFKPLTVLIIAAIMMLVCGIVLVSEASSIARQEMKLDDKGAMFSAGILNKDRRSKAVREQEEQKKSLEKKIKGEMQKGNQGLFWICVILIACLAIFKPVQDFWYYGAVILCGICDCLMTISIMSSYNRRLSRPLPQFKRKGGDDSANISSDI